MRRARIPQTLLAALLASAAAGAAPAAQRHGEAAPVACRGAYLVTFTVSAAAALAPGATYLCKARAVPSARALESLGLQALPVDSLATVIGSSAAGATGSWTNCTVEIPFYWIGAGAGSLALLSYEIDVVSGPGARAVPLRVQEGIGLAYPPPGGTVRLNLNLTF